MMEDRAVHVDQSSLISARDLADGAFEFSLCQRQPRRSCQKRSLHRRHLDAGLCRGGDEHGTLLELTICQPSGFRSRGERLFRNFHHVALPQRQ